MSNINIIGTFQKQLVFKSVNLQLAPKRNRRHEYGRPQPETQREILEYVRQV